MKVKDIGVLPAFFDRYILMADADIDVFTALKKYNPEAILNAILPDMKALGDEVYALGKWTIKQILQHCIDTERIMAYRALAFARGEAIGLPGFDENEYAINAYVDKVSLEELITEFSVLRNSTTLLFERFRTEDLLKKGTASGIQISPLALGFVMVGHLQHHVNVIKERYFVL